MPTSCSYSNAMPIGLLLSIFSYISMPQWNIFRLQDWPKNCR